MEKLKTVIKDDSNILDKRTPFVWWRFVNSLNKPMVKYSDAKTNYHERSLLENTDDAAQFSVTEETELGKFRTICLLGFLGYYRTYIAMTC